MGRYLLNEWFVLCCGNSFLWLCPILQYHKKDFPNNYLTIIYKSPWDIIKIIFYCKIIFIVRKKELHGRVTFHCFFPFWPVLIREQEIFKLHNRSQFQKFKSSLQKANFNSANISFFFQFSKYFLISHYIWDVRVGIQPLEKLSATKWSTRVRLLKIMFFFSLLSK